MCLRASFQSSARPPSSIADISTPLEFLSGIVQPFWRAIADLRKNIRPWTALKSAMLVPGGEYLPAPLFVVTFVVVYRSYYRSK